uniref:Interferon omega 6 n=1 Tax=Sus scrofa TaxID=9823 RepID=A0A8D0Y663_PIG
MAFVFFLLTALVVFNYSPGGSLGCDLSQNHVHVSRKNLVLLRQMRRISPSFCLKDRKDFGFPQEMVDGSHLQKARAISGLHETLQQTFLLLHTERSSVARDSTLLDKLFSGLYQQLEDLDLCLVQEMGEQPSSLGMAMKKYFQGIHLYLKEKKHSNCSWEIVRVEIMRALSFSTNLQERLRIMDADLGSP